MPHYPDDSDSDSNNNNEEEDEDMWNDAYTCHCSHDLKPWCDCAPNCTYCIVESEFYAEAEENYDGYGIEQDFITPDISWKYSNHHKFGDRTNELFATLLLGLQRLNDSGIFKEADSMMLEEMLENWTFTDTMQLT